MLIDKYLDRQSMNHETVSDFNRFIYDNRQIIVRYFNERYKFMSMFPFHPDCFETDVIMPAPYAWEYRNKNNSTIVYYRVCGWMHSMVKRALFNRSKYTNDHDNSVWINNFRFTCIDKHIVFHATESSINNNQVISDYVDLKILEHRLGGTLIPNTVITGKVEDILMHRVQKTTGAKCTH